MTTMAPRHRQPALPKGFTFYPEENKLTDLYLRRKIVGEDLPGHTVHFIHDADVYSAEPEKLVERFNRAPGTGEGGIHKQHVWYFFSTVRSAAGRKRKSRTIDSDAGKHSWHSEGGERPVKDGSEFGGYRQNFSYMVKNASTGKDERAGWIMAEYGISPEHGGGDLVLCEIHPSPRTSAMPGYDISKKRKMSSDDHAEDPRTSARPRHMVDQDEHDLWSYAYDPKMDAQPEPDQPDESAEDGPAHGFVFDLPDHVLIDEFLRRKLAGLPIHRRFNIHDADAYSVSPDQLVDKREHAPGTDKKDGKRGEWYFFTPARRHETRTKNGGGRRQRAVGEGYMWHSEDREEAVLDDAGKRVGYKLKLSYCFKESPAAKKKTRLGWCMTEFGLDDAAAGLVLCKVCVSRHKKDTTYESVMKAMEDCKRRMAGDDQQLDTPRPQTQEPGQLQAIQDDKMMPAGVVDDGSVDPAGFSASMLEDDELGCTLEELLADDDFMNLLACPAPEPDKDQMDASLRREGPEPDPEIIKRCSENVMPWPSSPTSRPVFWGM